MVRTEESSKEYAPVGKANDHDAASSLRMQLSKIDQSLQWLIHDIDPLDDDGASIAEASVMGHGKHMSDGSLKDQLGTSVFVFVRGNNIHSYVGCNVVPGEDDKQ